MNHIIKKNRVVHSLKLGFILPTFLLLTFQGYSQSSWVLHEYLDARSNTDIGLQNQSFANHINLKNYEKN